MPPGMLPLPLARDVTTVLLAGGPFTTKGGLFSRLMLKSRGPVVCASGLALRSHRRPDLPLSSSSLTEKALRLSSDSARVEVLPLAWLAKGRRGALRPLSSYMGS